MGGGHHEIHHPRNPNNVKEDDSEMAGKIRQIELIKHNPKLFYMNTFDVNNISTCLGGWKSHFLTLDGAVAGWLYYSFRVANANTPFYSKILGFWFRISFGAIIGTSVGYLKFGDRQRVHNAWVAERLLRRYPEGANLHPKNLWELKGVKPNHEFYRWT